MRYWALVAVVVVGCSVDKDGLYTPDAGAGDASTKDAAKDSFVADADATTADATADAPLDVGTDARCVADGDGDGVSDCRDGCAEDPDKVEPGFCGCGVTDPAPSTEAIGHTNEWVTASNRFRGNVYWTTRPMTLLWFAHRLEVTGSCSVGYFVYEGETPAGPWERMWSEETEVSGTGYHRSPPIDLEVRAETYYLLGVGWTCEATPSGIFMDRDTVFGETQNSMWGDVYSGYDEAYVPPNEADRVYAQQVSVQEPCP